jgi:hypothetical protein
VLFHCRNESDVLPCGIFQETSDNALIVDLHLFAHIECRLPSLLPYMIHHPGTIVCVVYKCWDGFWTILWFSTREKCIESIVDKNIGIMFSRLSPSPSQRSGPPPFPEDLSPFPSLATPFHSPSTVGLLCCSWRAGGPRVRRQEAHAACGGPSFGWDPKAHLPPDLFKYLWEAG